MIQLLISTNQKVDALNSSWNRADELKFVALIITAINSEIRLNKIAVKNAKCFNVKGIAKAQVNITELNDNKKEWISEKEKNSRIFWASTKLDKYPTTSLYDFWVLMKKP